MAKKEDMGSLHRSLDEDNGFFKQMIDLIPAKAYFLYNVDTKEKIFEDKLQRIKDQDSKTSGKGQKHGHKELSERARLKRANFDPSQPHTVSQIQDQLTKDNSEDAEKKQNAKKRKKMQLGGAAEVVDSVKKRKTVTEEADEEVGSSGNLDELRNKVQQKIESLRAKRKALNTQDYIDKKKLKRRMSKMKHKMKKKTEKHMRATSGVSNGPVDDAGLKNTSNKPIFNKEGKMVFSKFDFSASGGGEKPAGAKGKDYKKLLQKIERDKEKIDKLKDKDAGAAKVAMEKATWQKMLQKAEGVKLKDNPELLKKSMKKKEQRVKKSKKDWTERQQKQDERLKTQQDKRKTNINKKKQNRIDKKIKKAKKKGRILPGF